jgi:tRNA 2-thiocytidine biosynthesis protein TtcA
VAAIIGAGGLYLLGKSSTESTAIGPNRVKSALIQESTAGRDAPCSALVPRMTDSTLSEVEKKQQYNFNKLAKRLRHNVGDAINHFNMIEEGDKVMVCLSGGKDSYTMLDILLGLQKSAPINFSIVAVNLDQKQPGFPEEILPTYLAGIGVEYRIIEEDTYSIVTRVIEEGKTTCSLCSRLRRGILYRVAEEIGATKIALGHHRDDILSTLFLNMFYGGKLKGMPPKLVSDNGKHVVIRPLAYCKEKDIVRYAEAREFPIIPCNLCGSQPNLQRQIIADMLRDWDKRFPGRLETMFTAVCNVVPSHLADPKRYDFANIKADGKPRDDGDKAFDKEVFSDPARISIMDSRKPAHVDACGEA